LALLLTTVGITQQKNSVYVCESLLRKHPNLAQRVPRLCSWVEWRRYPKVCCGVL